MARWTDNRQACIVTKKRPPKVIGSVVDRPLGGLEYLYVVVWKAELD